MHAALCEDALYRCEGVSRCLYAKRAASNDVGLAVTHVHVLFLHPRPAAKAAAQEDKNADLWRTPPPAMGKHAHTYLPNPRAVAQSLHDKDGKDVCEGADRLFLRAGREAT